MAKIKKVIIVFMVILFALILAGCCSTTKSQKIREHRSFEPDPLPSIAKPDKPMTPVAEVPLLNLEL